MSSVLRLELGRLADADIVGILEYGAKHYGWDQAERYAGSFDESFDLLVRHPEIGSIHPDLGPDIRSWPHGSHRIFYSRVGEEIVVRRILHKSADVLRWLR